MAIATLAVARAVAEVAAAAAAATAIVALDSVATRTLTVTYSHGACKEGATTATSSPGRKQD